MKPIAVDNFHCQSCMRGFTRLKAEDTNKHFFPCLLLGKRLYHSKQIIENMYYFGLELHAIFTVTPDEISTVALTSCLPSA